MMKYLISVVALLLAGPFQPQHNTFALVQHPTKACAAVATSCSIMVSSTGSTNLLVIGVTLNVADDALTISSVSGAGTWTVPASCKGTDSGGGGGAMVAQNLSSSSGVTSITVTMSGTVNNPWDVMFREYSSTTGSIAHDGSCGVTTNGASCTACTGASASGLTGSNDVLVSVFGAGSSASSVNSPYGNGDFLADGNAIADHLNTTSATGATFNQSPSGTFAEVTIAFSEAAAGGAALGFNKRAKLEKLNQ